MASLGAARSGLDKPSSFEKDPVTFWHDVLHAEMAVGIRRGGVISTLFLVFCDDLHEHFLKRLAARLFDHRACNGGRLRGRWGFLRARQQHGAKKEQGE